ncbi:hypothetical protein RQP46_000545 [Phenoliferia psychrophenolica]
MQGVAIPFSIKAVSGLYANWCWFYNKCLLPSVPVFNLTVGQVFVCLGYQTIVLVFMFLNAGNLETNYKRPGYIAVAQIPPVFLLAAKNTPVSIVGKGYEKLNFLHRVAGRMMILGGALHTYFFFKGEYDAGKAVDFSVPVIQTGMVAICAFVLILITSIAQFRRAFYQIFLFSHIIGWIAFIVAINYHVPEVARPYTQIGLGGLLFDFLLRLVHSRIKSANVMAMPGGMTMIQIPGIHQGWRAGQHVWVRVLNGHRMTEIHPFTVGNAPADISPLPGAHNLTLMAKSTGDWTRSLLELATASNEMSLKSGGQGRTVSVAVEGPYGGPMFTDLSESQSVVLFAGGSGVTFAAAVLEELVGQACDGVCRTRQVTVVWSMKTIECADWYQELFNSLLDIARTRTSLDVQICLFVTGPRQGDFNPIPDAQLYFKRPDIARIIDGTVDDIITSIGIKGSGLERGGGIAVGTCGPDPLVRAVRTAVGGVERSRAVSAGGIVAHSECFGW